MLDVYLDTELVGTLDEQPGGLRFMYNERALADPTRSALSVRLPVTAEPYGYRDAAPFFDNLLPEGETRDILARTLHRDPSHTYALLGEVGGECAGSVSLWPNGQHPPTNPTYSDCTSADIERLFGPSETATADEVTAQRDARQSMSGTQPKLAILKDGMRYALPHAGAPTTALLKRERARYPALAANEIASLQLMGMAGVPVASGNTIPGLPRVFESLRYDRIATLTGIRRLHQEDMCQATGRLPKDKYADPNSKTNITYDAIKTVLLRHAATPVRDLEVVARWAIANACIGNDDAHAKNLSILYADGGIQIAPAYDVVCTTVYPLLEERFALSLGGAFRVEALTSGALHKFARSLNFTPSAAAALVDEVSSRIAAATDQTIDVIARQHGRPAILEKMRHEITRRTTAVRRGLLSRA
jgi:serine/threonine-protein kinase HipA